MEVDWEHAINGAKKKERTDFSLDDWQKYGFAGRRAQDFERLANTGDEPMGAVPRVHARDLSVEAFWERFEKPGLPCVISGIPEAEGWPAHERWTPDKLCQRFADVSFKVGKDDSGTPIRLKLDSFGAYMKGQADDSPLYVFDSKFGGHKDCRKELMQEYRVPSYFPDDYMALSGEDGRPPYRWIAVGPRRSGTVMHTDPLSTSAWNTCLVGRKRWVLLHPNTPRHIAKAKDVMSKEDDDEAVNVFCDLLPRLREKGVRTVEFVQYPGETVFLPGRWWHSVVNIDDTVAVTQNYCGRINFADVWRVARTERPCWSKRWLQAMAQHLPQLSVEARRLNEVDAFDMSALLRRNKERYNRRKARREERALRVARRKGGADFDEAAWRRERDEKEKSSSDDSSSTVSTSTAKTSSSDSDSSV